MCHFNAASTLPTETVSFEIITLNDLRIKLIRANNTHSKKGNFQTGGTSFNEIVIRYHFLELIFGFLYCVLKEMQILFKEFNHVYGNLFTNKR